MNNKFKIINKKKIVSHRMKGFTHTLSLALRSFLGKFTSPFFKTRKKIPNLVCGFTLLEMIVAIAVFTVVMTMAMEAVLNVNRAQKKVESFRAVSDNLNFALDAMSREIRTGNITFGDDGILKLTNSKGESVTYQLTSGQLVRTADTVNFPLTDPKINIDYFNFALSGEAPGDNLQPLVRINISATSGVKAKEQSRINLQTSVSQLKLGT